MLAGCDEKFAKLKICVAPPPGGGGGGGGGGEEAAGLTVMLKAGSDAEVPAALALITMLAYVPTVLAFGNPSSEPVDLLKKAQPGWCVILKVTLLPAGAVTRGANQYGL